MNVGRIEQPSDVKVRLPGYVVTEASALAETQQRSMAAILRLAVLAGLPTVRAMTTPAQLFDNEA